MIVKLCLCVKSVSSACFHRFGLSSGLSIHSASQICIIPVFVCVSVWRSSSVFRVIVMLEGKSKPWNRLLQTGTWFLVDCPAPQFWLVSQSALTRCHHHHHHHHHASPWVRSSMVFPTIRMLGAKPQNFHFGFTKRLFFLYKLPSLHLFKKQGQGYSNNNSLWSLQLLHSYTRPARLFLWLTLLLCDSGFNGAPQGDIFLLTVTDTVSELFLCSSLMRMLLV